MIKNKKVNLWIAIDQSVNSECFQGLDLGSLIGSITYQLQTYNYHEKILELLHHLDISPKIIIDCNNYVMSGLFLHRNLRFPQVNKTKSLICKIVGNNFDAIVQNFPNLEELTYISQDFIQIEQNLKSLKKLKSFKLECSSLDDTISDLKYEFNIQFYNSQEVSMQLYLNNANLDLLSILDKFRKFNLKKSEIKIN